MMHNIEAPSGAPAPLCLHAHIHADRGETWVYLCNASLGALSGVTVVTASIPMFQYYCAEPDERWSEVIGTRERRWDTVPAGQGIWLDTLSHVIWDVVHRHRLSFTDTAGQPWTAEVDDLSLNASRLSQEPEAVWAPIAPERA